MIFQSRQKFDLSPQLKFGVGRGKLQNRLLKYGAIISLLITAGLTVNALRLVLAKTSVADSGTPQVLGATDSKDNSLPSTPSIEFIEYKVKKGDTLFNISQEHNINWTTLATLNNLQSPFTLSPGQTIKIPK